MLKGAVQVDMALVSQVVSSVIVSLAAQSDSSASEVATAALSIEPMRSPTALGTRFRAAHLGLSENTTALITRNLEGILCWQPEGLDSL